MKIHDIKVGKNRFCGPAALSAITGRPVDEIVAGFHALNPGDKVMGTHTWELRGVLGLYGLSLQYVPNDVVRPTLAKWLRDNKFRRKPGRVYLMAAGNHWVVVSGRRIVCGKVLKVMSVRDYPHRRARVAEVYEVTGTLTRGVPEKIKARLAEKRAKAKEASKRASALTRARKLAKAHGIEIEREDDHWLVWPPEGFSQREGDGLPDDPYEGDHLAWDPREVEGMVEGYIKARAESAVNCTTGPGT